MTASKDLSSVMPSLIKIKMNCIDGKNFEAKEKYMQLFCNIIIAKVVAFKGLLNSQETLNSYMYTFKYRDKKKFRQIQKDAYKSLFQFLIQARLTIIKILYNPSKMLVIGHA